MSEDTKPKASSKKTKKESAPLLAQGLIMYADAGVKPNPGFGGFGLHGYSYNIQPPKKGTGNTQSVSTAGGYVLKSAYKDAENTRAAFGMTEEEAEMLSIEEPVEKTTEQEALPEIVKQINELGHKQEVTVVGYFDGFASLSNVSNNCAELRAATAALEVAKQAGVQHVTVLSDSEYVVRGTNEHLGKWETRNWTRLDGQTISNAQEWQRMAEVLNGLKENNIHYTLRWVRGHNGDQGNTIVDEYATMGRLLSQEGIVKSSIHSSPADGYWGECYERHAFMHHSRSYLTARHATERKNEYYMGLHGKEQDTVGKRDADGAYAYLVLKEPQELMEAVKFRVCQVASRDDALVMVYVDHLYRKQNANRIFRFGGDCLNRKDRKRLDLVISKDGVRGGEPIVTELYPPLIAERAINHLAELKGVLMDYQSNPNTAIVGTDVTHLFYEKNDKGVNVLNDDLDSTAAALKTNVKIRTQSGERDHQVTLTLGIDLPTRNALKKIEKHCPKVTVVTWNTSSSAFRYATVVECDGDVGIWAGFFSNMVVLKKESDLWIKENDAVK